MLLPREKYKSKKEHIITNVIIIGISLLSNLIWLGIASGYLVEYKDGAPGIKLQLLLSNPIEYIEMLLSTISVYLREYLEQLFGIGVGADLHIKLYSFLPILMFVAYMFESITDNSLKDKFTRFQKTIMILISLATTGLIFTSLYIQWGAINNIYISGIQGRYFFPILPLVSFWVGNNKKITSSYNEENHNKFLRNSINSDICIYNALRFNR